MLDHLLSIVPTCHVSLYTMAVVQYRYDRVELAPAFGGKKMLVKVCEYGYHLHPRLS